MEEAALSDSLFHSDNVKSFPFSRMEVYKNPYTESCVSAVSFASVCRKEQTYAESTSGSLLSCWVYPEGINHRASIVSPFPKAGACLGPMARLVIKP